MRVLCSQTELGRPISVVIVAIRVIVSSLSWAPVSVLVSGCWMWFLPSSFSSCEGRVVVVSSPVVAGVSGVSGTGPLTACILPAPVVTRPRTETQHDSRALAGNMQKFYWNNAASAGRDWRDSPSPHSQTVTLAINGNSSTIDCSQPYLQVNNSRTIKTNEHLSSKNNDNELYTQPGIGHHHHYREFTGCEGINFRIKTPTTKNHSAKSIHHTSSDTSGYIKVNGNKQCIQVNQSYLKDAANNALNCSEGNGNKVVLRLGDISALEREEAPLQRSYKGSQAKWQLGYNKTWNENMKGKYRQSIQTADIFRPDYDPVFGSVRERRPERDMSRQTPRSRKKSKQQAHGVYRSKSCEKVAGVIDKLSGKLSLTGSDLPSCPPTPAPPTPTPSLLHSVAARAIPCVDIKVGESLLGLSSTLSFQPPCISTGGRVSPAESLAYEGVGGDLEVRRAEHALCVLWKEYLGCKM